MTNVGNGNDGDTNGGNITNTIEIIHEDEAAAVKGPPTNGDDRSGSRQEHTSAGAAAGAASGKIDPEDENDDRNGRKLIGKKVKTTFGLGVVLDYRKGDRMYVIQILNNKNDINNDESQDFKTSMNASAASLTMLYTMQTPELQCQRPAVLANQLNVAYEALEKMRRLNLDIQCHELRIPSHAINHDMCTACLLANRGSTKSHFPRLQRLMDSANEATNDFGAPEPLSRLHSFFNSASSSVSTTTTPNTKAPNNKNVQVKGSAMRNLLNSTTFLASSSKSTTSRTSAPHQVGPGSTNVNTSKATNTEVFSPTLPTSSNTVPVASDARKSSEDNSHDELSSVNKDSNGNNGEPLAAGNPDGTLSPADTTKHPSIGSTDESNGVAAAIKNTASDVPGAVTEKQQNQMYMTAEAAAVFSAHPPPERTNKTTEPSKSFPRMRKLWGSIQSLPQPLVKQASSSPNMPNTTSAPPRGFFTNSSNASTPSTLKAPVSKVTKSTNKMAALSTPPISSSSSSTSFPQIRGFLNSSITTSIFGDNQVTENGSAADPNIIINGITSSQAIIHSTKSTPIKSDKPIALPRIQRLIDKRTQANTSPCLICASPSCPSHSSAIFRKENITLCLKCERLFELDFIVDCVSCSDDTQRSERIDYMIDCYDRCMLLLKYSKHFVKHIAASLEDQKGKQDKIGLASSSVGVLSGVLGIAAAASILTPAGPPLLIASLFFGGGATTVQTGTEAINYFSEPRKLADRIIALHGMALSILRVTSTLRDAMLRDHIRTDVYEAEPSVAHLNQMKESLEKNKNAVVMGSNFGRSLTLGGLAGVEAGAAGAVAAGAAGEMTVAVGASTVGVSTAGAAGARSATAFSRAGTAAARTVRFARFAGGALSAAVLVMEANAIQSTLKSIVEGSHCDKADRLRQVIDNIDDFPSTSDLDDECQAYLTALAARPLPPVEVAAILDDAVNNDEILQAECQKVSHIPDDQLCASGTVIVEEADSSYISNAEGQQEMVAAVPVTSSHTSSIGGSSLFQRIQSRQEERRSLAFAPTRPK
eukprot:CAMPEP_0168182598 /NCGR_PEP_ID=MMETSP0139_2-20121125/11979_1 /TAXON_ID=44445 /ORGANISM="Pseudo-nitzschia australis, Strain 10249 10 AB" /LENGTH=1044 /DNA_ID=CAMNT_0008103539 /DNA_START=194 /DNA_END=3328 /DNA_ORIENTATION=-